MTGPDDLTRRAERVGPFRILQLLGEGGMDTVYSAQQTEPVKRRIALQVIKVGMDSRAILARFEAEPQALAVMEHASMTQYSTSAPPTRASRGSPGSSSRACRSPSTATTGGYRLATDSISSARSPTRCSTPTRRALGALEGASGRHESTSVRAP